MEETDHKFKASNKMKTIKSRLWYMAFLASVLSFGILSCSEDEVGTPSITGVRVVAKDSTILGGEFGLPVAIQGRNLSSVREVYFNDVQAEIVPTYMTDRNILVFIPDAGPTDVTNTITVVSSTGKRVSCVFQTIIPPPMVINLKKEISKTGTENSGLGA